MFTIGDLINLREEAGPFFKKIKSGSGLPSVMLTVLIEETEQYVKERRENKAIALEKTEITKELIFIIKKTLLVQKINEWYYENQGLIIETTYGYFDDSKSLLIDMLEGMQHEGLNQNSIGIAEGDNNYFVQFEKLTKEKAKKAHDKLRKNKGRSKTTRRTADKNTAIQPANLLHQYELKIPGLYCFTQDNLSKIEHFSSVFLRSKTYGTSITPYSIVNDRLLNSIETKLTENSFFSIYGNSGRGKTFFVFNLLKSQADKYDVLLYFSPQFHAGSNFNVSSFVELIYELINRKSRILLVIDDAHLLDDNFKFEIFYQLKSLNDFYLLLVSRSKEEYVIPAQYCHDDFFQNFNKVSEESFEHILKKFSSIHGINLSQNIIKGITQETNGANLVFLTLLLQSWSSLLLQDEKFLFDLSQIRENAYTTFRKFHDHNHSDGWKYINHIVSALFQYEIRIDKRYLAAENEGLAHYGLSEYVNERMIHAKRISDQKNRFFYVFIDFSQSEELDMMKHAAEFRFYLEAYKDNLSFYDKSGSLVHGLNRMKLTQMVLENYILFRPYNAPEVLERIRQNATTSEYQEIMLYFQENTHIKDTIDELNLKILSEGLNPK